MAKVPADLKVCIFDVFGTVVDWRGSLIEDLPKLGKKHDLDTDWTSFADDWRGLYQPQMARVRKGELPWTRIDDLHKEAFEMLLKKRNLKHPGEDGVVGVHASLAQAPAVARFGRGHRHDEEEVRRGDPQQRQRGAPDQHGQEQRHPLGPLLLGRDLPSLQARPRILSWRGRQHVPQAAPGDAVRGAQRRSAAAQNCGLRTASSSVPTSTAPARRRDLEADGEWNAVGESIIEVAKKIGC